MDVTPQVINEVEFHQKLRGYDPDEVDDFLERVASAVAQLHDRVREAEERAAAAQRRAAEAPAAAAAPAQAAPVEAPPSAQLEEEAESIKRTLLLAQKTADAAVREAKADAEALLRSAEEQANTALGEAQERARRLVADAEIAARKASDETRQRIVAEIITLEEARDALRADQGILERHLDEQRLRLRSAIGDLQRLLDDPARLRAAAPPELSGVTRPPLADEVVAEAAADASGDEPETEEEAAPEEAVASADDEDTVIDLDAPVDADDPFTGVDFTPPVERPITGGVTFTPPEDGPTRSSVSDSGVALAADDDDTGAWARFVQASDDRSTGMLQMDGEDDAYLAELRKAMLEDTSATVGGVDDRRARTRFGRRR